MRCRKSFWKVRYVLLIENVKQPEAFPGEDALSKVATRIVQVKAYQGFSTPSLGQRPISGTASGNM